MKGKSQQAVGAPKAKLLANINPVVLYRPVMDEQLGADLFARFIVGDHMQNLPFGSRQVVEPRFILQQSLRTVAAAEKVSNQRRAHVEASRCNRADGFRNLDRRAILEDVALDSQIHGGMENRFLFMNGEKGYIDGNLSFANLLCYREAVLFRHIDIHDSDVRQALLDLGEQGLSIAPPVDLQFPQLSRGL
jgi:hypothetical protein